MKVLKVLIVILLISIMLYIPTISMAVSLSNDEKIINDLQTFGIENVPILQPRTRASQTEYNFPVNWRNQSIYLTRTNTNTGITITAWNNGSHTVDVCIFKQGSTSEVVGPTKTIQPNTISTLSWSSNNLTKETKIYVYFTMYGTYYNPMNVVITY